MPDNIASTSNVAQTGTSNGTNQNGSIAQPQIKVQEPSKTQEQMFAVDVFGKKEQVPVSKLIERYQKEQAAEQRMAEANAIKNQANQILSLLRTPDGFLQIMNNPAIGIDKSALLQKMLASNDPNLSKAAEEWMLYNQAGPARAAQDPAFAAEFEKAKFQREKEAFERQRAQEKTAREQQVIAQQVEAYKQAYAAQFSKAMATEGLPVEDKELVDEYLMKVMAHYAKQYSTRGMPVNIADCAKRTKVWFDNFERKRVAGLNEENVTKRFTDAELRLINKVYLETLKKAQQVLPGAKTTPKKSKKKMTYDEIIAERNKSRLMGPDGYEGED